MPIGSDVIFGRKHFKKQLHIIIKINLFYGIFITLPFFNILQRHLI